MEEHLPNGKLVVETSLAEHQDVKNLLHTLDEWMSTKLDSNSNIPAEWPAWPMELITTIRKSLMDHIKEEETISFPALRLYLPQKKLFEIGDKLEKARKHAPTRPHPSLDAHSTIVTKIVGTGAAFIDKAKDSKRTFKQFERGEDNTGDALR